MEEYVHRREKKYVKVSSIVDEFGDITPELIIFEGEEYAITHAQIAPMGTQRRWRITTRGKQTYLYYEPPRWYVMKHTYVKIGSPAESSGYRHPHSPDY